jgi:hypothetical protein
MRLTPYVHLQYHPAFAHHSSLTTAGLPGYWEQTSSANHRYSWYRKSTHGHNTLTFGAWEAPSGSASLGRTNQAADVSANISLFKAGATVADPHYAIIELGAVYAAQGVTSVRRGFAFIGGFEQLLIVDEFEAPESNVTWSLHTNTTVAVFNGAPSGGGGAAGANHLPTAQLVSNNRTLFINVLDAPSGGTTTFVASELHLEPPQEPTPGLKKLRLTSTTATGRFLVSLSLKANLPDVAVRPLSEWAEHGPLSNLDRG